MIATRYEDIPPMSRCNGYAYSLKRIDKPKLDLLTDWLISQQIFYTQISDDGRLWNRRANRQLARWCQDSGRISENIIYDTCGRNIISRNLLWARQRAKRRSTSDTFPDVHLGDSKEWSTRSNSSACYINDHEDIINACSRQHMYYVSFCKYHWEHPLAHRRRTWITCSDW